MPVKSDSLYALGTEPITGKLFRYIRTKFAGEPLSMYGALHSGGRYNVAGLFGALYLGFDRTTCEAEVSQGIAAGLPFKKGAFTVWEYDVALASIVRLDNADVQAEIGITRDEITRQGDHWTASGIGEHLHKRGDIEGLVAPSAQLAEGLCLDVYLERVKASRHVTPTAKLATWPT